MATAGFLQSIMVEGKKIAFKSACRLFVGVSLEWRERESVCGGGVAPRLLRAADSLEYSTHRIGLSCRTAVSLLGERLFLKNGSLCN